MPDNIKFKKVNLIHGLFWNGATVTELYGAGGDQLSLSDNERYIIAVPSPAKNKDTQLIPMTNVKSAVVLDEAAEAKRKLDAEKKVAAEKKAEAAKPKSAIRGVVRFVKNEATGAIEEKTV